MAFHKILCPVDFTPESLVAMAAAAVMAGERGEVVLIHAWAVPVAGGAGEVGTYPPEVMQGMIDEAQQGMDAAVAQARGLGARRVSGQVIDGGASQTVVEVAKADPAVDLIVIATHGRTGVARALLGSVAEEVVRSATVPVLAVRLDEDLRAFGHVLCPVDFSQESRAAVAIAAELAQRAITLLHVGDEPGELAAWASELQARVTAPVATKLRAGKADAELLAELGEDRTVDLVVMGSRGRTGLVRLALGSVAEQTVREARCPVLVTHGAPADQPG